MLRGTASERFLFIKNHRSQWSTPRLLNLLNVSKSGFYDWLNRKPSQRSQERRQLWSKIEGMIQLSKGAIGYRQITKQLHEEGVVVSKGRVQRLLQQQRYRAVMSSRRYRRPKAGDSTLAVANLLDRQFNPTRANEVWVSDITQIRCREGWLYVCVIIDLYSRAVIGQSMGKMVDAKLVKRALVSAKRFSGLSTLHQVLFHSDQGSQYSSVAIRGWLTRQGATISQSRRGNCWDNACAESFFSLMKQQWIYPAGMMVMNQMKRLVQSYISNFYNTWRVHGTLNQVPMLCYKAAV